MAKEGGPESVKLGPPFFRPCSAGHSHTSFQNVSYLQTFQIKPLLNILQIRVTLSWGFPEKQKEFSTQPFTLSI